MLENERLTGSDNKVTVKVIIVYQHSHIQFLYEKLIFSSTILSFDWKVEILGKHHPCVLRYLHEFNHFIKYMSSLKLFRTEIAEFGITSLY